MDSAKIYPFRYLTVLAFFFLCQSFQCEGDDYQHYVGGVVKDALTDKPVADIEIRVMGMSECVHTDSCGKFGFYDENAKGKYVLQFRDKVDQKVYADVDTLVFPRNRKVLLEVFLRKSIN